MIRTQRNETIAYCQKYLVLMLLSVVFYNNSMYGQLRKSQSIGDPQPQYHNFSIEQGLPSSETYFVHQDKKGYIWICTDRGVARYDGYRFRVFTKEDGLTDDVVFRIYEDKKGRLWFITYNGLLCYWDGQKICHYKYNNRLKGYLKKISTYKSFSIDENDNIYFNAQYNGLIKINSRGGVQSFSGLKTPCLLKINSDWLFDQRGVSKVLYVYPSLNTPPLIVPEIPARCELVELKGKRVVCTQDFLYDLDNVSKNAKVPGLFGLSRDDQYVWGLTSHGVLQYSTADLERGFKSPSAVFLQEQTVTCVMKDQEGGYWFSTLDNGVFYAKNLTVKSYSRILKNNNIRYVRVKNDQVICSNVDEYRSFGSENWIYRSKGMINNLVFWNDHIYLNTGRNNFTVNYSDYSILKKEKINNRTEYSLLAFKDWFDADTAIFFCASGFICSVNRQHKLTDHFIDIQEKNVKEYVFEGICVDGNGRIFVGNNNGIFEFRKGRFYQNSNPYFGTRIVDMDYHPKWGCAAATRGRGILFFENNKITDQLSVSDGLLSNQINKMVIDDKGILWVVTNLGLNCIIKLKDGSIKITSLTRLNGLPTNELNGVEKDSKGNIWLASKKGVVVVYSDHIWKSDNDKTKFWVEQIESYVGIYKRGTKELTFDSETDYIRFVFGTTNFRTGKNRAIRYRFSDKNRWIYSHQGSALITEPASGELRFMVHYKDENGVWKSSGESIKIIILPPFYATWYFIAGMILLGMFGMYLLFRMRLRQVKRKHDLKDTINQLEQKALRAQMNPHFIFNSLNSIQSFLIYEENEKAEKYLLKFAQLIRITLNNSRETYISIDAEIDSLKRYLELEQMRFKDKFTFEIHNELTPEELQYGVPPMLIQPFVENAVLHGFKSVQSGGVITLRFISLSNGGLDCEVEDNGVGRQATLRHKLSDHKSFGTKITEERLTAFRQKYGDDFRIEIIDKEENGEAKGTKVVLRIPVVVPQDLNLTEEV